MSNATQKTSPVTQLASSAAAIYEQHGFATWPGLVRGEDLQGYQDALIQFIGIQLKKLNGVAAAGSGLGLLDDAVAKLGALDFHALYEAIRMARYSMSGLRLVADQKLAQLAGELLHCDANTVVLSGPELLINLPQEKRALYTWHAEYHWYPKRRNFVNFWVPLGRSKSAANGTMAIMDKTHTHHWDFAEFYGFDKESEGNSEYFLQYEIPENELAGFQKVDIAANPGDLVAFHSHCVHTSTVNTSPLPSYAVVYRAFDFTRDLTISGNWAERTYRIPEKTSVGGRSGFTTA